LLPCGQENITWRSFFEALAFLSVAGGEKSFYHEGHEEHEERQVWLAFGQEYPFAVFFASFVFLSEAGGKKSIYHEGVDGHCYESNPWSR
jgi:hypothetical protein